MSWLSKALGLDKKPAVLAAVNAVGNTALTAVEAAVPAAASVVNAVKDASTPSNTGTAISDVEKIVVSLDPKIVDQVEAAVNAALLKAGVPQVIVTEVDGLITAELDKVLGIG